MKATYLLDTNFLISYLRAEAWDKDYLVNLGNEELFVSVITEMEILSYRRIASDEEARAHDLLDKLTIVDFNDQVKRLGISLRRAFNLKLPDAIIAATAVFLGAHLVTNDRQLLAIAQVWPELLAIKP